MTIDLTGVATAITGGIFSILAIVVAAWLQAHVKNQTAASVLTTAVDNSLGAIQQAATSAIRTSNLALPGVPATLAPGVQYVLDHAGSEASRLGITPVAIAQKIEAKIGLANIATNLAITASPQPGASPPLAAVAV